ncbi:MAG: AlpA family phage regulatory protein [Citrobacter sp.]|uniref:helix-turn-helix transcriptional regulator n=1 Tax=Comamonas suwonensis TaxID=2606214 RepID=UPI00145ED137|nr:AlpA family phage regulatory protein [Comamonas suwonensis]MBI1625218.1 AlpA family phage regulatory protein [Comamonas suwonensis]
MSNITSTENQIQPLIYTKAQLPAIVGLSKATIDRMRKEKAFPEAIVLCKNKVGWPVDVVKQWIAQRPTATGIY